MSTFSNNGFLQNKLAKRLWSHTGYAIASSLTFLWWPTPTTIMCYCRRHSPLLKQRLQLKDENTLTNCIDTTFLYHARPHWHKRTQRNTTSTSSIIIAASSNILCRSLLISDRLTHGLFGYAKQTPPPSPIRPEGIKLAFFHKWDSLLFSFLFTLNISLTSAYDHLLSWGLADLSDSRCIGRTITR